MKSWQAIVRTESICREKLEYLRPRWYGNIKEMIDFGRECVQNTNWTGGVRLMIVDAHYDVSQEIQDDHERAAYWTQPNVWADIQSAYQQYAKLYPSATAYHEYYPLYAARCGKLDEFLRQIRQAPTTNYNLFGGMDRFNRIMERAEQQH